MIIDFHTHVFPPQIQKRRSHYIDTDPCFAILYSNPKAKLATADELIASMDKEGVDMAVIVNLGWTTHELCVETNDYILESIARYPKRLFGFCTVQPNSCEAALAEIERCAAAGARVSSTARIAKTPSALRRFQAGRSVRSRIIPLLGCCYQF